MRISDGSSDVCSSDLPGHLLHPHLGAERGALDRDGDGAGVRARHEHAADLEPLRRVEGPDRAVQRPRLPAVGAGGAVPQDRASVVWGKVVAVRVDFGGVRTLKKTTKRYNRAQG